MEIAEREIFENNWSAIFLINTQQSLLLVNNRIIDFTFVIRFYFALNTFPLHSPNPIRTPSFLQ